MSIRRKKTPTNITNKMPVQTEQFVGDTITEQFDNYIIENRKISDIIGFLSVQNARMLAKIEQCQTSDDSLFTLEEEEDILEFYARFMSEFDKITEKARYEQWGQEPLILRIAEQIEEERWRAALQTYWDQLNPVEREEAKTLQETLMEIRENRTITVCFGADQDEMQCRIAKNTPKEMLDNIGEQLLLVCGKMVKCRGSMIIRLHKAKGQMEVFGIRILPVGIWSPLLAEETKRAECMTPAGFMLEPEDGVTYTQIERDKF